MLSLVVTAALPPVCDPEESAWLESLFKAAFPTVSLGERALCASNYESGAVVKLELTDRYFRGIAKIGFHYFLTQFSTYSGSEPYFADIRNFIADEGGGAIGRINTFIGQRQNPLLGPMMCGARPDGWRAHVLCAEIREELLAHVQLFVCADNCSPVYTVHLGTNHDGVGFCATGHIYKRLHEYFRLCNDQRRKQSSCEVN